MVQSNYPRSPRWALLPLLIAGGLFATFVGVWLYTYGLSPPASGPAAPWLWFPFGWFIFIPVVFLGFFALRWYFWGGWWGRGSYYEWNHDSAHEILRERFAKGEITKEQFDQMTKDLGRPGQESGGR